MLPELKKEFEFFKSEHEALMNTVVGYRRVYKNTNFQYNIRRVLKQALKLEGDINEVCCGQSSSLEPEGLQFINSKIKEIKQAYEGLWEHHKKTLHDFVE